MYLHVCPVCEHRNIRGSRFCNECGAPLQLRFCPACHAAADVLDLKCPACGVTLPQVALSEAADLPPEFSEPSSRSAAAPTDGVQSQPATTSPASEAHESQPAAAPAKPMREPERAPVRREPSIAAHAPSLDPLDPLTAPNFVPLGDPHGDAHTDMHARGDESAARFAAAKTASIIERLYGKSAPPPQAALAQSAAEPDFEPRFEPPRRKNSVLVTGALMLLAVVLIGLFFAATEPQPQRAAAPSPDAAPAPAPAPASASGSAPAAVNSDPLPVTVVSSPDQGTQPGAPQRQFEGTIRRPEDGASTASPPALDTPRDAPAPARGTSEAGRPPVAAAAEPSRSPPAARSNARPTSTPNPPAATSAQRSSTVTERSAAPAASRPPAQVGPCTPQVAALGLCTPAN